MMVGLRGLRGGLAAALVMFAAPAATVATVGFGVTAAYAQTVASIGVEGNRRIEADTIRSYFKPGPSGRLDNVAIDDGLKALINTGLFSDVRIEHRGGRVVVVVSENSVLGRVVFEGNKKIKDEQLSAEVQSKPRGTLSRAMVQSDTQRIIEIYRHAGRYDVTVTPEYIEQPNNRVDLIFVIQEGKKTGVQAINFVGNHAFSAYRLRDIIKTRESNILSFLTSGDVYDPDRVEADRDLIRRFYLKNGYADVQVIAALTEYDPSVKGFIVTFKIEEGQKYRVSSISFASTIPSFDANALRPLSRVSVGSVYNVEAVEKSVEDMTVDTSRRGYAFAQVKPRGDRNFENHTVSIVFDVTEGPRVYIERINIRGNTRTRDYVLRREFDIGEGDAYNRALIDRAERRLKNLDYFKEVKITQEPGSSPDRVIVNVDVEEKSTGDFSVSGGYSTADGALAEVSISERNLLGRGLYAKASVQYGQYARGYTLSFVEPYLLGYRVALGLDLYQREQLPNSYISYTSKTFGFSPRLGFQLREDLSLQVRYSISQQKIELPYQYTNCNNGGNSNLPFFPTPAYVAANGGSVTNPSDPSNPFTSVNNCYSDGEASIPVKAGLGFGAVLTSAAGATLTYNTLDNNKNPTSGILAAWSEDFAGLGGDVRYVKSTADVKLYTPIVSDIVGLIHVQGGILNGWGGGGAANVGNPNGDVRMLDNFQMGPNLVRGFAPMGIGPRDLTIGTTNDALGGTKYWGASAELQMPFWFLPKEAGLKGAVFADAGSLWDYQGITVLASDPTQKVDLGDTNGMKVRSSVGVGLIWASPFGPLRFDYAVPINKVTGDRVQQFRFGGGTSF
ncbi:outer membrane protein assembly factor BamA [Afipia felis]|uniref:Outer membrane protein assembly factor BamA n=2 Tax=Afipia felis TaxID=1035 RepID=A0A380W7I9_AFIFE|nr:outer membrane protein assembly factor BamA [Afipia felis]EKS28060.1 outer membrane protein assembly complex, YaeT protein [Afipia felis ATCC 53690]SUU76770.1 Omp85 [Afipia felis]SUU84836.1 Omp85 [Afipia felis]